MRKYMLFGASMLLLALASCSREKEIATGPVKLSFTAVVDEGATKTAYQNDKTASWVAGDQVSVYVTNGSDGQVVTFTANESLTFEGTAPAGYTTIVAGAYPADAGHTFDATGVKALNFPASYTLAAGADAASVLPLAGTFADGVMTFRHPAGALKFTIDNVPATAARFRFTAAGQKVNGSFELDPALSATEVAAEQSVDISFPAAEGSHSFYVPMPAGELAAGASIALYDAENNILFQKTVPAALTVSKNVIKRIAAVGTWTRNEAWQAAYLRDVYSSSSQKFNSYVSVSGVTGPYDMSLSSESYFNTHYGTVEGFLSSNYIPEKKASDATPKTGDKTFSYGRLNPGKWIMVIYGLDESYNFTGVYNLVEIEVPAFSMPENWHLSFNPTYRLTGGALRPAVHVQVPEGTSYSTINIKKEKFLSNYGGDARVAIWAQVASTSSITIRTNADINLYFSSLDETDYVYIVYGVTETEQDGRVLSFEYALLEYTYTKPSDEPTAEYQAWIGKWSVTDDSHTDTWTISAKNNNETYTLSGLVGRTQSYFTVEGWIDNDGNLRIAAQKNIGSTTYTTGGNEYDVTVNFYGRKQSSGSAFSGTYQLLKATMDASDNNAATLAPAGTVYPYYTFYGAYVNSAGENKGVGYGTRSANATMTRITEDGVLAPDDASAEDLDFVMTDFPVDPIEAVPVE